MNFKYKRFYKSISYALVPVLVACSGRADNAGDAIDRTVQPGATVVMRTPEMDSVVARYNYEFDSIDALRNKLDAAAKVYDDMRNVYNAEWDDFMARSSDVNVGAHNKGLVQYVQAKCVAMWDSAYRYDCENRYLTQNKETYMKNATFEVIRPAKTALDSLDMQYDRAVVAERCYLDAWRMVLRDYKTEDNQRTVLNKGLREYQAKKLFELSDSVAVYRDRQAQLLAKKAELQNTK